MLLLAGLIGPPWGIAEIATLVVFVLGIIVLVGIAAKALKYSPPDWFIQVCWVVAIVAVILFAIRLIASI